MLFQPSTSRGVLVGAAADAGVVDEDVDLAVLVERRLDRGVPRLGACDVGVDIGSLAAGVFDLAGNGLALIVENVGYDDRSALSGEQAGLLGSHATGASRDNRDLAFQSHIETSVAM